MSNFKIPAGLGGNVAGSNLMGERSQRTQGLNDSPCTTKSPKKDKNHDSTGPQQSDLRLSGPPTGQGVGSGARTSDRRVPADLRSDSLATVPPAPS
ncbi:hypothetical protein PoB_004504700 [Plakobranchus ocellatus]|uniref:Microtubule-associated protein Jupiter n=1 Tax=Plakobranchus ocellatus TaxID=259542 RepID=A0AAV4BHV5_9GAST|nr:hypothetical protein PoB_004504700 [Plakobranchus ocellatus]